MVASETSALSRIGQNARASQNLNQRINAKSIQVESGYNADVWTTTRLNEGDVVYSLSPNRKPEFFTSLETLRPKTGTDLFLVYFWQTRVRGKSWFF